MLDDIIDTLFDVIPMNHRVFQALLFAGLMVVFFVMVLNHQPQYLWLFIVALVANGVMFALPAEGFSAFLAALPPLGLGAAFVLLNL